ncbi:MAG TPA: 3-keto-5-aminohexanoate cleavage protein [Solirubrobacterales bacterium]|jgi:uncharacterized protein (DUF849 family)|nr:3-keto-5-aminohexanoate cleavage protein [Solirubrobacterales bacterium]
MLKVCLNGARTEGVPITPAGYAMDVVGCVTRGAAAFHVHPRDENGQETLDAEPVAAAVGAIRAASQGLPVGVTTREPIEPDLARRLYAIGGWTVMPDFASVNVHEPGAEQVARVLHDFGVGVEAGIWTVSAARAWTSWTVPTMRILLECMEESPADALANAREMLDVIQRSAPPTTLPRILLHGEGAATWPVLREAVKRRLDTRIGLEDTLELPDGSRATDNVVLVAAAVAIGAR